MLYIILYTSNIIVSLSLLVIVKVSSKIFPGTTNPKLSLFKETFKISLMLD